MIFGKNTAKYLLFIRACGKNCQVLTEIETDSNNLCVCEQYNGIIDTTKKHLFEAVSSLVKS